MAAMNIKAMKRWPTKSNTLANRPNNACIIMNSFITGPLNLVIDKNLPPFARDRARSEYSRREFGGPMFPNLLRNNCDRLRRCAKSPIEGN
ncbi:MAG: hypothetical protein QM775_15575 [Pirellulales bacterium]